jgi:predicted nucleic acid-binding protein
MSNVVVVDACVFNKLFLLETDRNQAVELIKYLTENDNRIIAPALMFYEILASAIYAKVDIAKVYALLEKQQKINLKLLEPDFTTLQTAKAITDAGHPKSGYPSFYDAIYHALAIENACKFVTADVRHYEKTKHLGYIVLLADWKKFLV